MLQRGPGAESLSFARRSLCLRLEPAELEVELSHELGGVLVGHPPKRVTVAREPPRATPG